MKNDRMPRRRLAGRLLGLAALAMALALISLVVAVMGLASMDDVCVARAPAETATVIQDVELWPPRVACRYTTTASRVVTTREDGEAQVRLGAFAIAGVLAVGGWAFVAHRVLRPRAARTQGLAAGPDR